MNFVVLLLGIASWIIPSRLIDVIIAVLAIILGELSRKKNKKSDILTSIGEVLGGVQILSFIIGLIL